ncbi:MAG: T9SS type A sorting domain-containing protein [bacterium]
MRKRGLGLLALLFALFPHVLYSVPTSLPGTGIVIYPPDEVLHCCLLEHGRLVIRFEGAYPWELDRANDMVFPMDLDELVDAIQQIRFPLDRVVADVLILPLMRIEIQRSSAEGSVIFLSPGVKPYSDEHIHYTIAHEIGHVVQHLLMPEEAGHLWAEYLALRGIQDESSIPSKTLREMFAEDFRLLFGGDLARFNGSSAIKEFQSPEAVPGLKEFILKLADQGSPKPIRVTPNPFRDFVFFDLDRSDLRKASLKIFDAQGRLINEIHWDSMFEKRLSWDGNSTAGKEVPPGVYFVVLKTFNEAFVSKIVKLPR